MISVHNRPYTLSDFLTRLQDSSTDIGEQVALQAWGATAVKSFLKTHDIPQFAEEAAYLSEVLSCNTWVELFRNLVKAIIDGNSDGKSLDPILFQSLAYMIRKADEQRLSQSTDILFSVFSHMKSQLEQEDKLGVDDKLYELVYALQVVVDAMVDVGVSDISHEELRKPLTNLLDKLSKKSDVHLAQVASYTAQSLRGIKDDDSRSKAARRGLLCAIDLTAKTLGALAGKDVNGMWDAVKAGYNGLTRLKDFTLDAFKTQTGKTWYIALRTTAILIRTQSWDDLYSFIQQAECRIDKNFLCGLCAQLDLVNQVDFGGKIKDIYRAILSWTDNERVRFWVQHSFPELDIQLAHPDRKIIGKVKSPKMYEWKRKAPGLDHTGKDPSRESSEFFNKAYMQCMSAKEYYTKNALMKFYTQDDSKRLQIQRLSGQRLPMDCCYINLTIVEDANAGDISLPGLFNRRTSNNKTIWPKKIFIEGQAGVGKTTLCKKIVYDFLHRKLWSDRFDWILWVPLRHLKGKNVNYYSLRNLFHHEYFSQEREPELLAKTLDLIVSGNSDKVLFLLDGLDEISQDWDADAPMGIFLQNLLRQPRTIISSRPYSLKQPDTISQDLKLRTVGFDDEQIEKYVRAKQIQPNPEIANTICDFIKEHSRIQEITRIPIQLDALCYTWKELSGSSYNTKTMTTIYQAIFGELLRKDLCRSEKKSDGRTMTEHDAETLSESEVQEHMQRELNVLEGLAFHGLYNGLIEFDAQARTQIRQYLKNHSVLVPESLDRMMKYTSFLRSSSPSDDSAQQSFHFLHLTVQDFFAARYFAKHLSTQKKLHMLETKDRVNPEMWARDFIAREKYNIRYRIFWRFVSGILSLEWNKDNRAEQGLMQLFDTIEKEPRDLLGTTHQRLIMNCISEVPWPDGSTGLASRCKMLHRQLAWWGAFEAKYRSDTSLPVEMDQDYPDEALYLLLQEQPEDMRKNTINAISYRHRTSKRITDLIASWMDQEHDDELNTLYLQILAKNFGSLPTSSRKTFDVKLRWKLDTTHGDSGLYLRLHGDSLLTVVQYLEHETTEKKIVALNILREQPASSLQPFINTIARGLSDPDRSVRLITAHTLAPLDLSLEIFQSFIRELARGDSIFIYDIGPKLYRQSPIPLEILNYTVSLLNHESWIVRELARHVLSNQPELPSSIVDSLIQKLGYIDGLSAISWPSIWDQLSASPNFLESVRENLRNPNAAVRKQTASNLGSRPTLPNPIIDSLVNLLDDTEAPIRECVVVALMNQFQLPHPILDRLQSLIQSDDFWISDESMKARDRAFRTLQRYSDVESTYFNDLVALLEDEKDRGKERAAMIMGLYQELPLRALEALFHELENKSAVGWIQIGVALQRVLPSQMVDGLLELLENLDWSDERCIIIAAILTFQPSLSPEMLRRIYRMLRQSYTVMTEEFKMYLYRGTLVDVLGSQATLPKDILASLLRDQRDASDEEQAEHIRSTISRMKPLPLETFIALIQEEDSESFINIIIGQSPPSIPTEILETTVSLLLREKHTDPRREIWKLASHKNFHMILPRMRMLDIHRTYKYLLSNFYPNDNFHFYFQNQCFIVNMHDSRWEIPMSLYHRTKLQMIFRLSLLILARRSEIELIKRRIEGWTKCTRGYRMLLCIIPIFVGILVTWIVTGYN